MIMIILMLIYSCVMSDISLRNYENRSTCFVFIFCFGFGFWVFLFVFVLGVVILLAQTDP